MAITTDLMMDLLVLISYSLKSSRCKNISHTGKVSMFVDMINETCL